MVVKCWQNGYGFSPRHRKLAREILAEKLVREGESPERAKIAVLVGTSITRREAMWLEEEERNRR